MSVREHVAFGAGRMVRWGLHDVMGRHASQLPGRVALALDPAAIAHARQRARCGSIVVCGTNGKTTTTNIVAAALEAAGLSVLCNRDGANMAAGIVSALLASGPADWAVLEADELSTVHIVPALRPRYLVLLNLFRDQLDRAGELDHVMDVVAGALAASPHTTLVVCGDDPLSWAVALRVRDAGNEVISFGIGEDLGLAYDRVPEARFCQSCGAELSYAYHAYAQLGAFSCPSCGFSRPPLDVVATDVNVGRELSFVVSGKRPALDARIQAGFGGTYMVYNLLAARVVAGLCGVDDASFARALDGFDPHNGRLQRFVVDGREVVLNLAKNPTGLNQNISLLLADDRPKAVLFVINDDFNDGRDISWIWDVDFERLEAQRDVRVLAGGHRANDVQVRLKYAGVSAPIALSVSEALGHVADLDSGCPLYVLANYSALWPAKDELEKMGACDG